MESFYKYLGLNKTKKQTKTTQVGPPKPGQKVTSQAATPAKDSNPFVDGLIGVLTSVKNIQINYTENQGTALPGFLPSIGFFGTAKPSLGFAFVSQDDIRFEAAKNGWLTSYPEFNLNYTQTVSYTHLDVYKRQEKYGSMSFVLPKWTTKVVWQQLLI